MLYWERTAYAKEEMQDSNLYSKKRLYPATKHKQMNVYLCFK